MVNSIEFAKRIEKILSFYGISATAFAEAIDFNRSTISHILSGRNKPSLEFVLKIVSTYPEVELYWLLNGKGSFPPTQVSSEQVSEEVKTKSIATPQEQQLQKNSSINNNSNGQSSKIDRIVIFYADGSFKEYLP